ncbi:response regulator [Sulfitobacter sp. HNIBRBA2951]|uniref:response regulator n=1 Tax=Sulfitobacter aquimarinus TaxID=3158557 RepID=UPI0032DF2F6A
MNTAADETTFSDRITAEMVYLRRYSRALTGSQKRGDAYTVATLQALLKDRTPFDNDHPAKVNLFKCFHAIWTSSDQRPDGEEGGLRARAQGLLSNLTSNSREALLLRTVEDFSHEHVGVIMGIDVDQVKALIATANAELADAFKGRVMIIEDEPIIAADLSSMVSSLGHTVTGIARTRQQAVDLGKSEPADLILADIQLADNSSGIDAVNDLMEMMDVPVIFITAFPERLLTGEKSEPAFLISKPFSELQVKSAVSQAMFFASTETLRG